MSNCGTAVIYNIWDSGEGKESQSYTSGMMIDTSVAGVRRYSCNDIGSEPDFSNLIFELTILST